MLQPLQRCWIHPQHHHPLRPTTCQPVPFNSPVPTFQNYQACLCPPVFPTQPAMAQPSPFRTGPFVRRVPESRSCRPSVDPSAASRTCEDPASERTASSKLTPPKLGKHAPPAPLLSKHVPPRAPMRIPEGPLNLPVHRINY